MSQFLTFKHLDHKQMIIRKWEISDIFDTNAIVKASIKMNNLVVLKPNELNGDDLEDGEIVDSLSDLSSLPSLSSDEVKESELSLSSISDGEIGALDRSRSVANNINVADFAKAFAQVPNLMNNNKDLEDGEISDLCDLSLSSVSSEEAKDSEFSLSLISDDDAASILERSDISGIKVGEFSMSLISDDDASILERSDVIGIKVAEFAKTFAHVRNVMNNNEGKLLDCSSSLPS